MYVCVCSPGSLNVTSRLRVRWRVCWEIGVAVDGQRSVIAEGVKEEVGCRSDVMLWLLGRRRKTRQDYSLLVGGLGCENKLRAWRAWI